MTLLQRLDGGYTLENFDGIGRVVKTNSPSNTAFRGFGGPEGSFFIETIMDRISYELDLSPLKGKYYGSFMYILHNQYLGFSDPRSLLQNISFISAQLNFHKVVKKSKNLTFKVNFLCQEMISDFFSLKNINIGE